MKNFSLFVLFLFISLSFMPEALFAEREVDHRLIKSVYFHISKSLGSVNSYVIFNDKDGNQCSTSGRLGLSKEKIDYVKESYVAGFKIHERKVPKSRQEHLKNINFKPNDFQYLTLRGGDTVYALPITLKPDDIERGDVIILKWCDFTIEEKVY
jgi:hypothetical protein